MDGWEIFFTVLVIVVALLVALYFIGRHMQKKQTQAQKVVDANRQKITAFIIDKKKARVTEANFPKSVYDQMPKRMKFVKVPLVKIKAGPQIVTMLCDEATFKTLPLKKQVTLEISGGYIMGYSTGKKGEKAPEFEKKLTWREKLAQKAQKWQEEANKPVESSSKKDRKKK